MAWCFFWLFLSLFAVVGLIETAIVLLEALSIRRIRSIRAATLRIVLSGKEEHPEYLMNTLVLMNDRLNLGAIEPVLEIVDGGIEEQTHNAIREYCEKNPWVRFTEGQEDDIIK